MKKSVILPCLFVSLIASACAKKPPEPEYVDIRVRSKPSDANVRFSTGEFCMTPCVVGKETGKPFSVTISKRGYKGRRVYIRPQEPSAEESTKESDEADAAKQEPTFKPNPVYVTLEPEWSK